MLAFHRLHEGFYAADSNGGDDVLPNGACVYIIRTTPALLKRKDGRPYRLELDDDHGHVILAEGLGLSAAFRQADEHYLYKTAITH